MSAAGFVYRYIDEEGKTRYIGKVNRGGDTGTIIKRAEEHLIQNRWMWQHQWKIYYVPCDTTGDTTRLERRLIWGTEKTGCTISCTRPPGIRWQ